MFLNGVSKVCKIFAQNHGIYFKIAKKSNVLMRNSVHVFFSIFAIQNWNIWERKAHRKCCRVRKAIITEQNPWNVNCVWNKQTFY